MELEIDRLTKQYKNKIAVDRVSIKLKPGVYGLLGANGAGKTTLMRMICDIQNPTSGQIKYNGTDIKYKKTRGGLQTSSWLFTTRFWILSRFYSL